MPSNIISEDRAEYIVKAQEEEIQESSSPEYKNPIRQLGFAMIEHVLTFDETISDGAYRTYAVLVYHCQKKKEMWAGIELLAKERRLSQSEIKSHLKELEDAGLIERKRRMGQSSMTYLQDLPKKYEEAAEIILKKRPAKDRKLAPGEANSQTPASPRINNKSNNKEEGFSAAAELFFSAFGRKRWKTEAQRDLFYKTENEVGPEQMLGAVRWAAEKGLSDIHAICTAARRNGKPKPRGEQTGWDELETVRAEPIVKSPASKIHFEHPLLKEHMKREQA